MTEAVEPDRLPPWAQHEPGENGYTTDTPINDGATPLVVTVLFVVAAITLALLLTL